MTTIKSYTDIEQSKKLAKFLPLESADMKILSFGIDIKRRVVPIDDIAVLNREDEIPCWSLAALFKVISNIFKYNLDYNGTSFILMVGDFEVSNKTAVDACVAMIEKLHEFKML